jgi:hypothetical protein
MAAASSGSAASVRAGQAFVEIATKDKDFFAGIEQVEKRLGSFAKFIGVIGATMAGGAAIFGGGMAAYEVLDSLDTAATEAGVKFEKLSRRLGDSAENLSLFAYAANVAGVGLEELEGNFENFNERLAQAVNGAGEASSLFSNLGLDARELIKLPKVDQMIGVASAMEKVANNTERLGMLSQLGGDQFQKMNDLFKRGGGGIRDLMGQGKRLGVNITDEEAARAYKVQAAYDRVESALTAVLYRIGEALIPSEKFMTTWVNGLELAAVELQGWIAKNDDLINNIELAVYGVLALGAGIVGVGAAILTVVAVASLVFAPYLLIIGMVKALTLAVSLLYAAVSVPLLAPLLLIKSIGLAAVGIWAGVSETGRKSIVGLASDIGTSFQPVIREMIETWGAFTQAIGRGDWEGAFKIITIQLKTTWANLTWWMTDYWNTFKKMYSDSIREMARETEDLWSNITTGIASLIVMAHVKSGRITAEEGEARQRELYKMATEAQEAKDKARQKADKARKEAREEAERTTKAELSEAKAERGNAMIVAAWMSVVDVWERENAKNVEKKQMAKFNNGDLFGQASSAVLGMTAAFAGVQTFGPQNMQGEKIAKAAEKQNALAEKTNAKLDRLIEVVSNADQPKYGGD